MRGERNTRQRHSRSLSLESHEKCKYINFYHNSPIGPEAYPASHVMSKDRSKSKGKVRPITGHESPEGE